MSRKLRGNNLSLFSPVRFWPLGGVSAAVYCISFSRNPKNCKGQVAFWGVLLAGSYSGTIHLLLSDVVMPKMNGQELATQIRVLYLQIKCLCMSGYTADVVSLRGILDKECSSFKNLSAGRHGRAIGRCRYNDLADPAAFIEAG